MKITPELLHELFNQIANVKGKSTTRRQAITDGQESYYQLDYSHLCRGYNVIQVNVLNGTKEGTFGESMEGWRKPSEMYHFLLGILAGLKVNSYATH